MRRKFRSIRTLSKRNWPKFAKTCSNWSVTTWSQTLPQMKPRCSSWRWRPITTDTLPSTQFLAWKNPHAARPSWHTIKPGNSLRPLWLPLIPSDLDSHSTIPCSSMKSKKVPRRLATWLSKLSMRPLLTWTTSKMSTTKMLHLSCSCWEITWPFGPPNLSRMKILLT